MAPSPWVIGGTSRDDLRPAEHRVQRRAQFVADRGEEVVLQPARAFGIGPGLLLALEQGRALELGVLPCRDVLEEDGHLSRLGFAEAEGVDVEPPLHRLGVVLEADRLARQGHGPVRAHPPAIQAGHELEGRVPDGVGQSGGRVEGGVGLHEPIVARLPVRVEQHLHDAEAVLDGVEQHVVPRLARAQRGFGGLLLRDVAEDAAAEGGRAVCAELEGPVVGDPLVLAGVGPEAVLDAPGRRAPGLGHHGGHACAVVGVDARHQRVHRHGLQFGGGQAHDPLEGGAEVVVGVGTEVAPIGRVDGVREDRLDSRVVRAPGASSHAEEAGDQRRTEEDSAERDGGQGPGWQHPRPRL
jgi:hypothetical protein